MKKIFYVLVLVYLLLIEFFYWKPWRSSLTSSDISRGIGLSCFECVKFPFKVMSLSSNGGFKENFISHIGIIKSGLSVLRVDSKYTGARIEDFLKSRLDLFRMGLEGDGIQIKEKIRKRQNEHEREMILEGKENFAAWESIVFENSSKTNIAPQKLYDILLFISYAFNPLNLLLVSLILVRKKYGFLW